MHLQEKRKGRKPAFYQNPMRCIDCGNLGYKRRKQALTIFLHAQDDCNRFIKHFPHDHLPTNLFLINDKNADNFYTKETLQVNLCNQ